MCCLTALSSRTASAAQGHAQSQVAAAHVLHLDATALARMLSPRQVPSSVAAPQRRRVQRNKLLNDGKRCWSNSEVLLSLFKTIATCRTDFI